uniref:Methyltransferase type 11 domain-containing protein n=1 Tax=Rhizochromulina marina TaxID=1034831 RepID=A0A7S2SEV0_9STRA|mmetsp:Transcript_29148/g.85082  ORF Transcript_29148/g.85082 Transcript_29148/m.85082 type:complete len:254 (+) Transcript_29148:165-926(+)
MALTTASAAVCVAGVGGLVVLSQSRRLKSWVFAKLWLLRGEQRCHQALASAKTALFRQQPLRGRVLDVGTGAGLQLDNLVRSPDLDHLVCVEPNPFFTHKLKDSVSRAHILRKELGLSPVCIEIFPGTVEEYLEAGAGGAAASFDNVTCLLVLCSIPDPQAVLGLLYERCLRPGGHLYFLEHVAAPKGTFQRILQVAVQPVWDLVGDGCHLCRETGHTIQCCGAWGKCDIRPVVPDHFLPVPFLVGWAQKPGS